jgi:hypothetical protein
VKSNTAEISAVFVSVGVSVAFPLRFRLLIACSFHVFRRYIAAIMSLFGVRSEFVPGVAHQFTKTLFLPDFFGVNPHFFGRNNAAHRAPLGVYWVFRVNILFGI